MSNDNICLMLYYVFFYWFQAHGALDSIYYIRVQDISSSEMSQVIVAVSRLLKACNSKYT